MAKTFCDKCKKEFDDHDACCSGKYDVLCPECSWQEFCEAE